MSVLEGVVTDSDLWDLGGLSGVRKRLVDSHCKMRMSGVAFKMVEVVGAGHDLGASSDNGKGFVVRASLGVDGGSQTVDTGLILSSDMSSLGCSTESSHSFKRYIIYIILRIILFIPSLYH